MFWKLEGTPSAQQVCLQFPYKCDCFLLTFCWLPPTNIGSAATFTHMLLSHTEQLLSLHLLSSLSSCEIHIGALDSFKVTVKLLFVNFVSCLGLIISLQIFSLTLTHMQLSSLMSLYLYENGALVTISVCNISLLMSRLCVHIVTN